MRALQLSRNRPGGTDGRTPHWRLVIILVAAIMFCGLAGCYATFGNRMASSSASGAALGAIGHSCPSCNMSMYFTGGTQVEWGKLMKQYRCPVGHVYWYNDTPAQVQPIVQDPCPICGLATYFTGKTRVEWGKLQRIYACPVGHQSVK